MYSVKVHKIETVYPCDSNKGFCLRFSGDSQVWHEIHEEGWRIYQPKCFDYYYKDAVNSLNILNNDNWSFSSRFYHVSQDIINFWYLWFKKAVPKLIGHWNFDKTLKWRKTIFFKYKKIIQKRREIFKWKAILFFFY